MAGFLKRFWKVLLIVVETLLLAIGVLISLTTTRFKTVPWVVPTILLFVTGIILLVLFVVHHKPKSADADLEGRKLAVDDPQTAIRLADFYLRTNYGNMIVEAHPRILRQEGAENPIWVMDSARVYYPDERTGSSTVTIVVDAAHPEHIGVFDDVDIQKQDSISGFLRTFSEHPPKQKVFKHVRYDDASGQKIVETETTEQDAGPEAAEFARKEKEEDI